MTSDLVPDRFQRISDSDLVGVVAGNIGTVKVGFPRLEDRTKVNKGVILLNGSIRKILLEGTQCIRSTSHLSLVPVDFDAMPACAELVDLVVECLFWTPGQIRSCSIW